MSSNIIATNKKAYRDYILTDKFECGIALKGPEVKSMRAGEVDFKGSFALVEKEEIILYNLHINPYPQAASYQTEDPDRPRKLLLNRREIERILGIVSQKHLVLVPTKLYFNKRGFVKVELALGKGKKLYDKRETIKKRNIERELKRALKEKKR